MTSFSFEIFLIVLLLLANGLFAMAEIALVASRKARLKTLAENKVRGARTALELSSHPENFLSTVQVGITLVGVLAGAVGGARLSASLARGMEALSVPPAVAEWLAIPVVVGAITYFSVIVGELFPKRLALSNPERIAAALALPMTALSKAAAPIVGFLNWSSDILMAIFGIRKTSDSQVSEEEVRVMIDEGLSAGVFKKAEKEMVEGVFDLDEQIAGDLMTPRARMVWLCLDDPDEENWRKIAGSGHSHFPVYQGTRDNVVGLVSVKSLWANLSLAGRAELRPLVTPPLYVPASMPAGKLIDTFKRSGNHIALVVDEFGGVQGLVTLYDLLAAIVGNLPERGARNEPKAVRRQDGSWLVDGMLDIDEMKRTTGIGEELPGEADNLYATLGGFALLCLGHIPKEGDKFSWGDFDFEILDMDRQRIDKVLVVPRPKPAAEECVDGGGEAGGDEK